MVEFFRGTVTTSEIVKNLPAGGAVFIQTDGDIGVAWFNDALSDFGDPVTINSPGRKVVVAHYKARITAASPASVQITQVLSSGLVSAEDIQEALGEQEIELNGFTLADHTDSVLADGVYAEDAVGRMRRHDAVTVGGNYVAPNRTTGMTVVDFTGKGATPGTNVLLATLDLAVPGGDLQAGDYYELFGTTTFALDPDVPPNATPDRIGFGINSDDRDFWDLSNEAAVLVYQDVRQWMMRINYNGSTYSFEAPACIAVQQITTDTGGAARTISGTLTEFWEVPPAPPNIVAGVSSIPFYLKIQRDAGVNFTAGTARVTWDLETRLVRA